MCDAVAKWWWGVWITRGGCVHMLSRHTRMSTFKVSNVPSSGGGGGCLLSDAFINISLRAYKRAAASLPRAATYMCINMLCGELFSQQINSLRCSANEIIKRALSASVREWCKMQVTSPVKPIKRRNIFQKRSYLCSLTHTSLHLIIPSSVHICICSIISERDTVTSTSVAHSRKRWIIFLFNFKCLCCDSFMNY